MTAHHAVTVPAEQAGQRLDKYLAGALEGISRARVQQLIDEGAVQRNGQPISNASAKVREGEAFTLTIPELRALNLTPEKIALSIIYEDNDILIIDKPPGMTVHPAPGASTGTLVHALLAHCGDSLSGIGGVARPGIVHRIDKETSGLLAVAKNDAAHQHLSDQLKERTLKRTYLCYTWGSLNPRDGSIEAEMGRNPRMRKQMAVVRDGKYALTHYQTVDTYIPKSSISPIASKVICNLDTGRTHQIRVHMQHAKCPLIGDPVYGMAGGTRANRLRKSHTVLTEETVLLLTGFHRQALHALELALIHPSTGEEMQFFSPIPADLQTLEEALVGLTNRP